jgi:uncharacterized membrane protein YgdD (TMEM256/DUF423 family)
MPVNRWLSVAAVNGAVAVMAGAFAVHALKATLPVAMLEVFRVGAQYHLTHALALGLAAVVPGVWAKRAAWLFFAGIVLFSGSLYALALTRIHAIGMATPFGGLAFILGWFALAIAGWKRQE